MALDRDRIRFLGKLLSAAMRQGGSLDSDGSKPFEDAIYAEWQQLGRSLDEAPRWLDERLQGVFAHLTTAPTWVEDEPSWPFCQGQPMVFISQTTFENSDLVKNRLSEGETVYLFAAREPYRNGFKMRYEIRSQFQDGA